MSTEALFSVTVKSAQGNLVTVRGNSVEEFTANVISATDAGLGALVNELETNVKAGGTVNRELGATPVDLPTTQAAPQAPQAAQNTQTQPAPQAAPQEASQAPGEPLTWGQQPPAGDPLGVNDAWRNDPTIQPPHLTPPETPFGPATYHGGVSQRTGRPYRMWRDPRPFPQIRDMQEVPLDVLRQNPNAGRMKGQFIDDQHLQ